MVMTTSSFPKILNKPQFLHAIEEAANVDSAKTLRLISSVSFIHSFNKSLLNTNQWPRSTLDANITVNTQDKVPAFIRHSNGEDRHKQGPTTAGWRKGCSKVCQSGSSPGKRNHSSYFRQNFRSHIANGRMEWYQRLEAAKNTLGETRGSCISSGACHRHPLFTTDGCLDRGWNCWSQE